MLTEDWGRRYYGLVTRDPTLILCFERKETNMLGLQDRCLSNYPFLLILNYSCSMVSCASFKHTPDMSKLPQLFQQNLTMHYLN